MWTKVEPPKQDTATKMAIDLGPINLRISETEEGNRWQWFYLSFGCNSEASMDECLQEWPRAAIARARAALDKFEASLGESDETSVERWPVVS